MKYKILVDSLSNLKNNDINDELVDVKVIPLTLRIDGKEYVDNSKEDYNELVKLFEDKKQVHDIKTSCPSPNEYLKELNGADKYIIITVSRKLSGSFNSAMLAKNLCENSENVFVLDSQSCSGVMELLVLKAIEMVKENKNFVEIKDMLEKCSKNLNLLFVLDKYDSLVKTGRVSKIVTTIVSALKIKPIGIAKDGEIHIQEKVKLFKTIDKRILSNIEKLSPKTEGKTLIISHTQNSTLAEKLKLLASSLFKFKNIIIRENDLIASYYSLSGAVILGF